MNYLYILTIRPPILLQSHLFIPTISLPILLQQNKRTDRGNIYIAHSHKYMNEEMGNEAGAVSFLGIHKSDLVCCAARKVTRLAYIYVYMYSLYVDVLTWTLMNIIRCITKKYYFF